MTALLQFLPFLILILATCLSVITSIFQNQLFDFQLKVMHINRTGGAAKVILIKISLVYCK